MRRYVSIVHKTGRSGYRVSFPDLPGCASRGATVDAAIRAARTALDGHLDRLCATGEPVPEPRDFPAVVLATDSKGAIAFILI
jgi:predicted RNase H-like HicB family nuclease